MRNPRKVLLTILLIFAGWWLLQKFDVLPPFRNPFKAEEVVIDKTPILVKEIQSIGQLITYSALDEVVVDSTILTRGSSFVHSFNRMSPFPLPSADKHLVLIAKGKILAGTNMASLTNESVTIKNDTIWIVLPKPQIIDAIVNPTDFETFVEKGSWTHYEVTLVKIKARRKMIDRALQRKILEKAGTKSRDILTGFLKSMGYKNVFVS